MFRIKATLMGAGVLMALSGCSPESCDSVRAEMEKISAEVAKNPTSAPDRAEELEALSKKMAELNCPG